MKFIDEATITVRAGNGGRGCVSFHRARFIPKGRANGGDGGDGGSVYLVAKENLNTLVDLRTRHFFEAQHGGNGTGSDRTGKKGEDLTVPVPVGTMVYAKQSGELISDIIQADQPVPVAYGGRGGLGNTHFKSATNRTPRQSTNGDLGEERELLLELKLLADVGLLGLPNSGKSTLLSTVSAAHPKIADYPFTTLVPILGVVAVDGWHSFVMADLPGLVAGAAKGVGLGTRFLRHVQRTNLLLHLVDIGSVDIDEAANAIGTVETELADSDAGLIDYPRWLVCTKIDLLADEEAAARQQQLVSALNWTRPVFAISAVSGRGTKALTNAVMTYIENEK